MSFWKRVFCNNRKYSGKEKDYALAYQYVMDYLGKGHVPSCIHCEDVDVKFWLPEMNGVNVTILCDKFIKRNSYGDGLFVLVTDLGCINCVSTLNIEQQSSGFKIYRQSDYNDKTLLFLSVSPDNIKSNLLIPDDYGNGFVGGNKLNKKPIPSHLVSTERYNCKYILNFSVCGEFNLDIGFMPLKVVAPIYIFSKSFSCK